MSCVTATPTHRWYQIYVLFVIHTCRTVCYTHSLAARPHLTNPSCSHAHGLHDNNQSLYTQYSDNTHPTQTIHRTAGAMQTECRTIIINWIPSHVGIAGNVTANRLAIQDTQELVVSLNTPQNLKIK